MSANIPFNTFPIYNNAGFKPIANYGTSQTLPTSNPLAPLKQDTFVKTAPAEATDENETQNKTETEEPRDTVLRYENTSVSSIQKKIADKKRDLQFYEKQLKKYPDNAEYGRKIDKLRKEIKDLERELARAC